MTDAIPIKDAIVCDAFEVAQPVGKFYVATMSHEELCDITFADVRRIEKEERDVERVLGIQRPLSVKRIDEIGQYVNTLDATFPAGIILAVESFEDEDKTVRNVFYKAGKLYLRRDYKIAKVLDGQHRIEGLRAFNKANGRFDVIVTVFVDADIEQQALIFATINKSQTKVNKSLVYDLFDFAKNRSPEKTCHNIAILLNKKENSPFKNKIKILGTADDEGVETLTQATFVEGLMQYITNDPLADRDFLKRNPSKKLPTPLNVEPKKLFLRQWFRNEEDEKIARLLWNYFEAVQKRWPTAWNTPEEGIVLCRSTGFIALMRLFKDVCHALKIEPIPSETAFRALFDKVQLTDSDINRTNFVPGSSGQRQLYRTLLEQTGVEEQLRLL